MEIAWLNSDGAGIVAALLFGVFSYVSFLRRGKLAHIVAEFAHESRRQQRLWKVITASYICGTFLLGFGLMFVFMMRNRGVW